MGKVKWGLIAAAVVAIVVVLLTTQGVFQSGGESDEPSSKAVAVVDEPETEADGRSPGTSTGTADNGNATGAAGTGDDAGTGDEADTGDGADTGDEIQAGDGKETRQTTLDAVSDTDAEDTGGGATSSTQADGGTGEADGESERQLQEEAESFVRQLAEPSDEPLQMESAEGFVGAGRPLTTETDGETEAGGLPEAEPVEDAVRDEPAVVDTDSTEAGQPGVEDDTLQQPAAAEEAGGDATAQPDKPETGTPVESATVGSVVEDTGVEETGVEDIANEDTGVESARPARADLPLSEETPVTLADLLGAEEAVASDAVFYVHTVRPTDDQGIWGIVHDGILKNFAAGVAVHRGEQTETYQVDIPRHADEPRSDSSSSYLGRLIYQKSRETYVYNYRTDRLGRNPDLIYPGQEIVIVSFSPEELIEIYKHFVGD